MNTVGQSLRDFEPRLVVRRAFLGPLNWQTSCQDGFLEFNVLRVPDNRGVKTGQLIG